MSAGGANTSGGAKTTGGGTNNSGGAGPGSGGSPTSGGKGGNAGSGGSDPGRGGNPPTSGGSAGQGGTSGASGSAGRGGGGGGASDLFSFFLTSLAALRELSMNEKGFGGDLRFGKADGLSGADEICRQIAEKSMPGNGKTWRAFLSASKGEGGGPVHAIDRVGEGPWYDRKGRLVANTKADLAQDRPRGADSAIINDLPNENGIPNKNPDGTGNHDNHAVLTGSGPDGKLWNTGAAATCQDWTSKDPKGGKPHVGYAWPAHGKSSWLSIFDEPGCAPGVVIVDSGGPNPNDPSVGSSGGYGGFYCLALTP